MSSAMPDAMNYHRWILGMINPHITGRVLEVGFGYGQYSRELARHVTQLVAVDCDPRLLSIGSTLPDNVELRIADLGRTEFASTVGEDSFDSVVCINVLEHIEDDLAALQSLFRVLRPGGNLLLFVPAMPALYGSMDEMAGHFRRYSRRLLRQRLNSARFELIELRYFNPLGAVGWWVNAKVVRPKDLSQPSINQQILWYDKYVQPISRLIDPLTRRFFGQSLWVIGRKPRHVPVKAGA
jgi:SAM-dependent methyltransferase